MDTETYREEVHKKTEAETGETWTQAKEHLKPPEAGEARKDSPLAS